MKISEIIEKILAYHPDFGPNYHGCDEVKSGNPEVECTGIVTALSATVNVIRKAMELNANLIIVHEPTYYTSADAPGWFEDFGNKVYEEKAKLLNDNGIVVWRDHDHLHAHKPDGIFTGVLKYCGWEDYSCVDTSMGMFAHFIVNMPEAMTLRDLLTHLTSCIGCNGARYIGKPDMMVKKLAFVAHLYPMAGRPGPNGEPPKEYSVQVIKYLEEDVDVLIPGEVIDWTAVSYVRDAMQLKKQAALINLGHYNWEELGMKYAKDWLSELISNKLPVTYVPTEDIYSFYVK